MNIHIHYKDKRNSSGIVRGGDIVLYISSRLSDTERRRHIQALTEKLTRKVERAVRQAAPLAAAGEVRDNATLAARAAELNGRHYGLKYAGVTFWTQKVLWGSCNRKTGVIHISHRLKAAPAELLDYVLIHELCHLREPGHGPRFWALVARGCPDYRQRRRQLAAWGSLPSLEGI